MWRVWLQCFESAGNFNQYIGGWDTSKVTTMSQMFYRDRNFNQDIELEYRTGIGYEKYVLPSYFLQPRYWELEYV